MLKKQERQSLSVSSTVQIFIKIEKKRKADWRKTLSKQGEQGEQKRMNESSTGQIRGLKRASGVTKFTQYYRQE